MRRHLSPASVGLAVCLFMPVAAFAQFAQYTPPGEVEGRPESRQERLEEAMEEARWRLGPVRVDPWLGLQDVGWADNLAGDREGDESRFTATAGAGLRAYLPTGPKVFWAAHFLPEYAWVDGRDDLNDVNGRFGAGMFGFFNRLEVEATASRSERLGIVTSELLERLESRSDALSLAAEVRLTGGLYVFAAASETRIDHRLDRDAAPAVPAFDLLDRRERVVRGGVKLRTRPGWAIGVGAERSEVDFDRSEADRSNSGTSPILVLELPGNKLFIGLDLAWRSLEPEGESRFVPYDGLTGDIGVLLGREGSRLQLGTYARRQLIYSLGGGSYFEEDRFGLRAGTSLGRRLAVHLFGEVGENDHRAADPASGRADDVTAYGLQGSLGLVGSLQLTLNLTRQEVRSELPEADRSTTVALVGVTLGIGERPSPWY